MFSQSVFNDLHDLNPEEEVLTLNEKTTERAKYKIKKITVTKRLSDNRLDSLIKIDPKKNFVHNHSSTIETFEYDRSGLLISYRITPLNVMLKKEQEPTVVKIIKDSLTKEHIVEHYYDTSITKRDVYLNGLWIKSTLYNERYQTSYLDKNNKNRDTAFNCKRYLLLKYNDKKQVVYREYMNTEYITYQTGCNCIEYENYEYKKNKISAIKTSCQKDTNINNKYFDEITLNKKGQVKRSAFYSGSLFDYPNFIYTLKYDKQGNIKSVTEALDVKDKGIKVLQFDNYYNANGMLMMKIDVSTQSGIEYFQKVYHYNKYNFLSNINYCTDSGSTSYTFDYEFY